MLPELFHRIVPRGLVFCDVCGVVHEHWDRAYLKVLTGLHPAADEELIMGEGLVALCATAHCLEHLERACRGSLSEEKRRLGSLV